MDAVPITHGLHCTKSLKGTDCFFKKNTDIVKLHTHPAASTGALIPDLTNGGALGPIGTGIKSVRDIVSNVTLHGELHVTRTLQNPHLPLDRLKAHALETKVDAGLPGGLEGIDMLHDIVLEKKVSIFSGVDAR